MSSPLIVAIHIRQDMEWKNYKSYVHKVSKERKVRIFRMINDLDRLRLMISELLARKYISKVLDIKFNEIEFVNNPFGKPYIKQRDSISFNWSHSGEWILFTIDSEAVGIDVEQITSVDEIGLASSFFDPLEVIQLENLSQENKKQHFFRLWSLKESYVKWKGTGLNTPLRSFRFLRDRDNKWLFYNDNDDICFFQTIDLDSKHCAAICTSKNHRNLLDVELFSADYFLNNL